MRAGRSRTVLLALAAMTCIIVASPAEADRIYVKADATGANNGTSWEDAYVSLLWAMGLATSGDSIWVAAATYVPGPAGDRGTSFYLLSGVAVVGGFSGIETSVGQRDIVANPTILSGDIGIPSDYSDNSYHVLTTASVDSTASLDGFVITRGNANGPVPHHAGAGVFTYGGSPTFRNVVIRDNRGVRGVGWYNEGGSPKLIDVEFRDNIAYPGDGGSGGGMWSGGGNPMLRNVLFVGNSARLGGAFHTYGGSGHARLINCVFFGNIATDDGGTAGWGGAVYLVNAYMTMVNCTIAGNQADRTAGGIYVADYGQPAHAFVTNSILWNNTAPSLGNDQIVNVTGGVTTVDHSLVEGCGGSGAGWDSDVGVDAGGNTGDDPAFVDQANGNLRLGFGSPAMETGDNAALYLPDEDFDGKSRILGDVVDMGAYETEIICSSEGVLYVDADAAGEATGASWTDAVRDLRNVLRLAHLCPNASQVWVAEGTYTPGAPSRVDSTFELRSGLALYGGFAGTEAQPDERDIAGHPTILSGSIGGPGQLGTSYHVVTSVGVDSSTVLDGFTVTGGSAGNAPNPNGGGMLNVNGSPTIRNVTFSSNAAVLGGGFHSDGGAPTLSNVAFEANAGTVGGGMSIANGGHCTLVNAVFSGNQASNGGALYNQMGSVSLVNALFRENIAVNYGGAVFSIVTGDVVMTNVTFHANTATTGGAIYNNLSSPTITNAILWGNDAPVGSEIANAPGAPPFVSHCLVEGSGGSGAGWDGSLGIDGGGNIDEDPLFVDGPGGDLHLGAGSPAIDAGDNDAPELSAFDLDGKPRILGGVVDMGPFESDIGTGIDDGSAVAPGFALRPAFPNPFNRATTIPFSLSTAERVSVSIYDARGGMVRALRTGTVPNGSYRVVWDGRDDAGKEVSTGVYFLRVEAGAYRAAQKIVLIR